MHDGGSKCEMGTRGSKWVLVVVLPTVRFLNRKQMSQVIAELNRTLISVPLSHGFAQVPNGPERFKPSPPTPPTITSTCEKAGMFSLFFFAYVLLIKDSLQMYLLEVTGSGASESGPYTDTR